MAIPKSSPPPPPSPTHPIFRISEILTSILSHLPPVQLLTSARLVCKEWKDEIETDPILRWRCWVPSRPKNGIYKPEQANDLLALDGVSLPPPSIRNQYSNKSCTCSPTKPPPLMWTCGKHAYTDTFEIHPVAIHFLELFWRRFMSLPLSKTQEIMERNSRDALMEELVVLIKPNLKEFEARAWEDPAPGIRRKTSYRLIRPENLSGTINLYCGIEFESLIETKLHDNGTKAPTHCQSSKSSKRKMLSVKDLVYNVMHRTLFGDVDINEIRKRREEKGGNTSYIPDHYSVILQIESKYDHRSGLYGGMQNTEVEITLALYEPYNVVKVQTRRTAQSINSVQARSLARYSPLLDQRAWFSPFVARRTPWKFWARSTKPKPGVQLPEYSTVYTYYQLHHKREEPVEQDDQEG